MSQLELTDADQLALRTYFRSHWENGVAFNKACNIRITRWDIEGVTLELPYRDDLGAHPGVFHGGAVSALIDTSGAAAVMAGHDFNWGSRLTTISLSVQFLSVAPGEDARAEARCTRRGRTANYSEVHVYGADSDKLVAQGILATNVSGARAGFEKMLARARELAR